MQKKKKKQFGKFFSEILCVDQNKLDAKLLKISKLFK